MVQLSALVNLTQGTRQTNQGLTLLDFTPYISELLMNETLQRHGCISTSARYSAQTYALNYIWDSPEFDADYNEAAAASAAHVCEVTVGQGQTDIIRAPIYPNYALSGTPLEDTYGVNVPALQALKAWVDPQNVIGFAGGWKF